MPLNTTNKFIDSLITFCGNTTKNILTNTVPFPRWKAPVELENGNFETKAAENYKREISEDKLDQDAEELIKRGNEYYFSLMVKKSHRLFNRDRIESVSINKSLEKGFSDSTDGFLAQKYKLLGDKVDPNDVGDSE